MSQDFFKLNADGEELDTSGKFESGGRFDPIPKNTQLLAAITDVKWDEFITEFGGEDKHHGVNITYTILAPEDYKNRKVFQKVHLGHPNGDKADNAMRMFVAIDANAGGKLHKAGVKPTDADLVKALVGKQMMIVVDLWKNGDKSGNWVRAVAKKGKPAETAKPKGGDVDF